MQQDALEPNWKLGARTIWNCNWLKKTIKAELRSNSRSQIPWRVFKDNDEHGHGDHGDNCGNGDSYGGGGDNCGNSDGHSDGGHDRWMATAMVVNIMATATATVVVVTIAGESNSVTKLYTH